LFVELDRTNRQNAPLVPNPRKLMLNAFRAPLLAGALACATLGATAAAAQAPPAQPVLFEGPGGRMPLTHWTLRQDPSDHGAAQGWQRGGFGGASVTVPNVVSAQYTGKAGERNSEGSVAWYRTTFKAPIAATYALTFQSANFIATVWVDGRALGSHRGSYLPFEMRHALAAGTHVVVVRIDWRDPARQAREGFHRTWFNWGGLDGEVDVRQIGLSELSEPTLATTLTPDTPSASQADVKVSVQVRNDGPARSIAAQGTLARAGQTVPISFPAVTLAHGQSTAATAHVTVANPALWSHSTPNLYTLTLSVPGESSYSANVGVRQLTWHGGRVFLNGRQLHLHGASIQENAPGHGDALTPGDEARIVDQLRSIGANSIRTQHPLDPSLLERLDVAGILVWQGIGPVEGAGNWYSTSPALLGAAERQARSAAVAAQLHPSIFAWNLVDEVAGNGRDAQEVSYVQTMARWLHNNDPTRLVAVDVWGDHPPQNAGALYSNADAIAETDYSGWYDSPTDTPAQLVALMRSRLAAMERTFAGKVLVISEFGAESNGLNASSAPGGYGFQSRLLESHIDVYAADPKLTAMFVWVLGDYPLTPTFEGGSIHFKLPRVKLIEGLNQKGLFTYGASAKPAAGAVGRLFRGLPSE
jgi:hypothetical protein